MMNSDKRGNTLWMLGLVFTLLAGLVSCAEPSQAQPTVRTPTVATLTYPRTVTPTIISVHLITFYRDIIWHECQLADWVFGSGMPDSWFGNQCLQVETPQRDETDVKMNGELLQHSFEGFGDWRLVVGSDVYTTVTSRSTTPGMTFDYRLMKNNEEFATASAYFTSFSPNLSLMNIEGKAVWFVADITHPVIIWDGVNLNQKYALEGSYFPYVINHHSIFLARKDGKFQVIYNGERIGSQFDAIDISYCCGGPGVIYGHGQYRFWGKREGRDYVVAILGK